MLTGRVWSLPIWRRQKSDTSPTGCNRRRGKLKIFLNSGAYIVAELEIFPSPRAQEEESSGVKFLQVPRPI